MPMRRKWMAGLLAGGMSLSVTATDSGRASAESAMRADLAAMPGNDITYDYRGRWLQSVDLDGDGIREVIYLRTATCNGFSADCPNDVMVLARLNPDKSRKLAGYPGMEGIRASGYAEDASAQIPGDVTALTIAQGLIRVSFVASPDSQACKRGTNDSDDMRGEQRCPGPGHYTWTYRWRPGVLTRVVR